MASRNHVKGQRKSCQTFSSALSSAAAEWLLILLMYFYGLLSYLVTRFALYSKLQVPCLLCSRLENVLGCERPGSYKDLICHVHKLEISSLAYCRIHQKLADIHEMCETCLLLFATEKKSNPETYGSLVGKLERNLVNGGNIQWTLGASVDTDGVDVKLQEENVADVPLLKEDRAHYSPRTRYCSCCNNQLFHKKPHVQRSLQIKSTECDGALLGQVGHDCFHHQDRSNQAQAVLSPSASQIGERVFDCLSHIWYTQLKLTSDSELEVPFSDDDDRNAPVRDIPLKQYPFSPSLKLEPANRDHGTLLKTLSEKTMPDKLIHATTALSQPSHSITLAHLFVADHQDNNDSSMPEVTIADDLKDLNWNEFGRKDHPSTSSALTSQNTKSLDEAEVSAPMRCTATTQGSHNHLPPAKDNLEISNSKSGELGTGDTALVSSTTFVESPRDFISTRTELKQIQTTHKPGSFVISHMDLNDAYRMAIGYKMNQPSPRDYSRSHEDLKYFLSQVSVGRGLEFLYNDLTASPRVNGQVDDSKFSDASSTVSQQSIGKKFSTEKNESGFESLNGCIISETEGESLIDHLKWQIELARKSISLLSKELEEERSACAIAANQAMAMITRLQEEKAAVQTEALQYQRMMEEQAEYDQEALQQTNDLLTEKEKEIQDLEAEIESYKKQLAEESFPTKVKDDAEEREDNVADTQLTQRSAGNRISEQKDTAFLDAEKGKKSY